MPDDKNRQRRRADAQSAFGGFGSWSADHSKRQKAAQEESNQREKKRAEIIDYQNRAIAQQEEREKRINDLLEARNKKLEKDRSEREAIGDRVKQLNEDIRREEERQKYFFYETRQHEKKKILNLKTEINGLGDINKLTERQRDAANEVLDAADLMVSSTVTLSDLEEQLFQLRAKGLPKITAGAEMMVEQNIRLMKQTQIIDAIDEGFGGVWEKVKGIMQTLQQNPILLLVTGIIAALKVGKDLLAAHAEKTDTIGKSFGYMAKTNRELAGYVAEQDAKYALWDINLAKVSGHIDTIADDLGFSAGRSLELAYQFERIGMGAGLTNENVQSLYSGLVDIAGISENNLETYILQAEALAHSAGVAPQAVMRDIATSTEFIAEYTRDGATNIVQSAINAKKFGINLSAVQKIADSLLNVETSINDEFQASLMIGKQLNFMEARKLALYGKTDEAVQNIVSQLGGAAEFSRLDVLQRKSLAGAIGLEVSELAKVMNRSEKVTDLSKVTKENMQASVIPERAFDKAISGYTKLQNLQENWKDIALGQFHETFETFDDMAGSAAEKMAGVFSDAMEYFKNHALQVIAIVTGAMMTLAMTSRMIRIGGMGFGGKGGTGGGGAGMGKMYQTKTGRWKYKGMAGPGFKDPNALIGKFGGGGAKTGFKSGIKSGGKGLGKTLLKKIPGIGLMMGLGFGLSRLMQGDFLGAGGELLSGAASTIPGWGTAASFGIDGLLMGRDMGMVNDGGFVGKDGKFARTAPGDSVFAVNEDKHMQILSKRAGIYGAAGGRSGGTWEDRQMNIFASKIGNQFYRVMNNVKWDTRTSFKDVVKTATITRL